VLAVAVVEVATAVELVAPSWDDPVVPDGDVVDVVARDVVVVGPVVEVAWCSTGFAVVEVGDTETDTGIWATGVVRTTR